VKLLKAIKDKQTPGSKGLNTRTVCDDFFNSRNYGMRMIHEAEAEAEDEGYIKRVKINNHEIRNILTPRGMQLLQSLEKYQKVK
jgi:hypothetical protein